MRAPKPRSPRGVAARSYGEALLSPRFALALAAGTGAALLRLWLYATRIELSRAVLWMGAVSILGGVLFGVIAYRERLDALEGSLLAATLLRCAWRPMRGLVAG